MRDSSRTRSHQKKIVAILGACCRFAGATFLTTSLFAACNPDGRLRGANPAPDFGVLDNLNPPPLVSDDPRTCEEAETRLSYLGCDFWPTTVANPVWSIFDFAVVVANPGTEPAEIIVIGRDAYQQRTTVAPGALEKIYLPWVPELKGSDFDVCALTPPTWGSILSRSGAYHLISSRPVSVYQFNALEYKPEGGPPGKDWSACQGMSSCYDTGLPRGCFSFSNDASLLLPTTTLTGTYRITGVQSNPFTSGGYFAVTATADDTDVAIRVGATGKIMSGGGMQITNGGQTTHAHLDKGDVLQVMGDDGFTPDLSGSLVHASKPVQVIAGVPCINNPEGQPACDHVEESVPPTETLGRRYIVTAPTAPSGYRALYTVRFFGNVDGTQLSYDPPIANAPRTLYAGQVVMLDTVVANFQVTANQPFAVGVLQKSAAIVDISAEPPQQKGDPSFSLVTAIEQYRTRYIFLAPDDYDVSFVDIIAPPEATLALDAAPVVAEAVDIGMSGFAIRRVKLGAGQGGAHTVTGDLPFGIQVIGYGSYTSYQYPGGLNLNHIAPAPVIR